MLQRFWTERFDALDVLLAHRHAYPVELEKTEWASFHRQAQRRRPRSLGQ
jgi:hypothetical protein